MPKRPGRARLHLGRHDKIDASSAGSSASRFEEGVAAHARRTSIAGATRRSGTRRRSTQATRTWFILLARPTHDAPEPSDFRRKIKTREELREILGARPRPKKVIMCHGTFDLVHPGHVRHLMYAKRKADVLVASLTSRRPHREGELPPVRAARPAGDEPRGARGASTTSSSTTTDAAREHLLPASRTTSPRATSTSTAASTRARARRWTSSRATAARSSSRPATSSSRRPLHRGDAAQPRGREARRAAGGGRHHVRRPARRLDGPVAACACTWSATRSSTPTLLHADRRHRARRRRFSVKLRGARSTSSAARRSSPSTCGRPAPTSTFSTVLGDDPLQGLRADGLEAAGIECRRVPSTRRGRPPGRTSSSPAATACSRSTGSTTGRSPTGRSTHFQSGAAGSRVDAVVFSDFRHGIFGRTRFPS